MKLKFILVFLMGINCIYSSCLSDQYLDSSGNCQYCSSECASCSSKFQCITCTNPILNQLQQKFQGRENLVCIECTVFQYVNIQRNTNNEIIGKECQECNHPCDQCLDQKICLTCKGDNRIMELSCQCAIGFVQLQANGECVEDQSIYEQNQYIQDGELFIKPNDRDEPQENNSNNGGSGNNNGGNGGTNNTGDDDDDDDDNNGNNNSNNGNDDDDDDDDQVDQHTQQPGQVDNINDGVSDVIKSKVEEIKNEQKVNNNQIDAITIILTLMVVFSIIIITCLLLKFCKQDDENKQIERIRLKINNQKDELSNNNLDETDKININENIQKSFTQNDESSNQIILHTVSDVENNTFNSKNIDLSGNNFYKQNNSNQYLQQQQSQNQNNLIEQNNNNKNSNININSRTARIRSSMRKKKVDFIDDQNIIIQNEDNEEKINENKNDKSLQILQENVTSGNNNDKVKKKLRKQVTVGILKQTNSNNDINESLIKNYVSQQNLNTKQKENQEIKLDFLQKIDENDQNQNNLNKQQSSQLVTFNDENQFQNKQQDNEKQIKLNIIQQQLNNSNCSIQQENIEKVENQENNTQKSQYNNEEIQENTEQNIGKNNQLQEIQADQLPQKVFDDGFFNSESFSMSESDSDQ